MKPRIHYRFQVMRQMVQAEEMRTFLEWRKTEQVILILTGVNGLCWERTGDAVERQAESKFFVLYSGLRLWTLSLQYLNQGKYPNKMGDDDRINLETESTGNWRGRDQGSRKKQEKN